MQHLQQIQQSNPWENMTCPSKTQKTEKIGLKLWHSHFNILVYSVSLSLSRNPDGAGQQAKVPKQNTSFKSWNWFFLKIVWKISTVYFSTQPADFFYFKFWVDEAWPIAEHVVIWSEYTHTHLIECTCEQHKDSHIFQNTRQLLIKHQMWSIYREWKTQW